MMAFNIIAMEGKPARDPLSIGYSTPLKSMTDETMQYTKSSGVRCIETYTRSSELGHAGQILPASREFHRIDTAHYPKLPAIVKHLLTQSAGKAVVFTTNSKVIGAKWCVSSKKQLVNLSPVCQKGSTCI